MSSNKKLVIDKPFWWKVLLVVLGTLYLIPEAIFNSQLVSLLGLGTPSKENLEHLELFGRSVSGIGVTLLFADFLKGKFINNIPKAILSFSVLLICTWSIVFYGQKYLVETFIIETSTAEQRQQAVYSSFLRDALSTDTIHINSVNYDSAYLDSPENLTFLALFGGLAYADASLAESLEDSKEKIIYNFVQKKAYNDFERHYSDYSQLYNELSSSYESYADGSYKYNNTILNIPQREAEYWIEVEQNINNGYNKYKEAQKSHIAKASGRAQEYGEDIFKYFEAVNKCRERYKKSKYIDRRNKCIEDKQIRYRKNIMKLGLGYIEPDYWLIPIKISTGENLLTSLIGGVLTGGLYTGMQAIDAVYSYGYELSEFTAEMLTLLRNAALVGLSPNSKQYLDVPSDERERLETLCKKSSTDVLVRAFHVMLDVHDLVARANRPRLVLEMAVARLVSIRPAQPIDRLIHRLDQLEQRIRAAGGVVLPPSQGHGQGRPRSSDDDKEPSPEAKSTPPEETTPQPQVDDASPNHATTTVGHTNGRGVPGNHGRG